MSCSSTSITKNEYVCMDTTADSNYKLGSGLEKQIPNLNINREKKEISLDVNSSNHYFTLDEKAHCDEKWQDWFCIQNYHNGNSVNKYPNIKTMSVGVCYNSCEPGYIKSANNKCIIYYDEDDLNFNPLAIIAMLGTMLQPSSVPIPGTSQAIPNYNNINDTIGMRGSYLNDLYRLNIKDGTTSITSTDIQYINTSTGAGGTGALPENYTKQQKLLLYIIKQLANKEGNKSAIIGIKEDIKKAVDELYDMYITRLKGDEEEQGKLLNKIKNYDFNMENLKKIYGKDKNNKRRLPNIILYAYNIMRFVFYDKKGTQYTKDSSTNIDNNIRRLLEYNSILKGDKDDTDLLIKIFKYACYNCFNVNYDVFNNYIKKDNADITSATVICIVNDSPSSSPTYTTVTRGEGIKRFEMSGDETTFLEASIDATYKYEYPYYNDITFYDHQLLHEYSENTQYITKILLIFGTILGLITAVLIFYWLLRNLSYQTGIDMIKKVINFVNYCFLFYNNGTFSLIMFFTYCYYYLIYSLGKSNYTIVSVFFKLINISIIIVLVVLAFIFILELLNIDYVSLLKNMNYFNKADVDREKEYEKIVTMLLYMFSLYLIAVYMYSVYIIRFSITASEYNIMANVDSQDENAVPYINNIMARKYNSNITSSFNFMFSKADRDWANKITGTSAVKAPGVPGVPGVPDSGALASAIAVVPSTRDVPGVPDSGALASAIAVVPSTALGTALGTSLGELASTSAPVDTSALFSDARGTFGDGTGAFSARGTDNPSGFLSRGDDLPPWGSENTERQLDKMIKEQKDKNTQKVADSYLGILK